MSTDRAHTLRRAWCRQLARQRRDQPRRRCQERQREDVDAAAARCIGCKPSSQDGSGQQQAQITATQHAHLAWRTIKVLPGQVLVLPPGWWHHVTTCASGTFALNMTVQQDPTPEKEAGSGDTSRNEGTCLIQQEADMPRHELCGCVGARRALIVLVCIPPHTPNQSGACYWVLSTG